MFSAKNDNAISDKRPMLRKYIRKRHNKAKLKIIIKPQTAKQSDNDAHQALESCVY